MNTALRRIRNLPPLVLLAILALCHSARAAATFLVTSNTDDGPGSLRQAIIAANLNAPGGVVQFSLPPGNLSISLLSPLPFLTNTIVLDGWSQPGFSGVPLVELDGSNAGTNAHGLVIFTPGNVVRGFVIHNFDLDGIVVSGGGSNVFQGNVIGTDVFGTNFNFGNLGNGLDIQNSPGNLVGGPAPAQRNVVSGNKGVGLILSGSKSVGNIVQGNFIGTDASGSRFMANFEDGIAMLDAPGNLIGGNTPGTRNIVSGNVNNGVLITGTGSSNNVVQGNYCGVDVTGEFTLGNYGSGVLIQSAPNNLVGGGLPGTGNLLSANLLTGVTITGNTDSDIGAYGNVVQGNWVGIDASATLPLPNATDGMSVYNSPHNTFGGTNPAARNVSSANGYSGLYLDSATTVGTVVIGNYFGVAPDGITPMGNSFHNVQLDGAILTQIGGPNPGEGNVIAYSQAVGYDGVRIHTGTGNSIRGNSIYLNAGEAIDLGPNGANSNTLKNAATDQGQWQNYPVLKKAVAKNGTTVSGALNSYPRNAFVLDFYADTEVNPDGYGEGRTWLGFTEVKTDGKGDAAFSVTLPEIGPGAFISATATGPDHSTSEFSLTIPVLPESTLQLTQHASLQFAPPGGELVFTTTLTNLSDLAASNLVVRIDLPPDSLFQSSWLNGSLAGLINSNSVSFPIPTLPGHATALIVTTFKPLSTGYFPCTATLQSTAPSGVVDRQIAFDYTQVLAQSLFPTVQIAQKANMTFAPVNGQLVFTTTVTNYSSVTASNLVVTINLPPASRFESSWLNGNQLGLLNPDSVTFPIPLLAGNTAASIVTTLTPLAPGNFACTASLQSTGPYGVVEQQTGTDRAQVLPQNVFYSVQLAQKAAFQFAPLDGRLVFTTTLTNLSTVPATNLVVTINFPPDSRFESSWLNGSQLGLLTPDLVTFSIPILAGNGSASIVTTFSPLSSGYYPCTANLQLTGAGGALAAETATDSTHVLAQNPIVTSLNLGGLTLQWTGAPGDFDLRETASLVPPVTWTRASTDAILTNGIKASTSISVGGGARFFRLVQP